MTLELMAPCWSAFLFSSLKLRSAFWSLVWSWKAQLEVTERVNTKINSYQVGLPRDLFSKAVRRWSCSQEGCSATVWPFPRRLCSALCSNYGSVASDNSLTGLSFLYLYNDYNYKYYFQSLFLFIFFKFSDFVIKPF